MVNLDHEVIVETGGIKEIEDHKVGDTLNTPN
jgi:hypothetical protein